MCCIYVIIRGHSKPGGLAGFQPRASLRALGQEVLRDSEPPQGVTGIGDSFKLAHYPLIPPNTPFPPESLLYEFSIAPRIGWQYLCGAVFSVVGQAETRAHFFLI